MAEQIKPEALKIGDKFRLTGDACDEGERNDKNTYEVVNIDTACKLGAHIMAKNDKGEVQDMRIYPWVPLLKA